MSIIMQIMACLEAVAATGIVPRVKAVHLPQADKVDARRGEFCAVELDDGTLGLSYVLLDDSLQRLNSSGLCDRVTGLDALELARAWTRDDPAGRTLGFAATNAIARTLFDRTGFRPDLTGDSLGGLTPSGGDHIGMVGFFSPLVSRIVASGARLTVLELKPDLAGVFDGYRVTLDAAQLRPCNKVICTSTALLNHSLEGLLAHCQSATRLTLLGPGASCLPDPLFAHGVTALAGSWITDPVGVIEALDNGRSWSPHAVKFLLERSDYPGIQALLKML